MFSFRIQNVVADRNLNALSTKWLCMCVINAVRSYATLVFVIVHLFNTETQKAASRCWHAVNLLWCFSKRLICTEMYGYNSYKHVVLLAGATRKRWSCFKRTAPWWTRTFAMRSSATSRGQVRRSATRSASSRYRSCASEPPTHWVSNDVTRSFSVGYVTLWWLYV